MTGQSKPTRCLSCRLGNLQSDDLNPRERLAGIVLKLAAFRCTHCGARTTRLLSPWPKFNTLVLLAVAAVWFIPRNGIDQKPDASLQESAEETGQPVTASTPGDDAAVTDPGTDSSVLLPVVSDEENVSEPEAEFQITAQLAEG